LGIRDLGTEIPDLEKSYPGYGSRVHKVPDPRDSAMLAAPTLFGRPVTVDLAGVSRKGKIINTRCWHD
jgi:hypothetical protein